jgi:hypothetical protein
LWYPAGIQNITWSISFSKIPCKFCCSIIMHAHTLKIWEEVFANFWVEIFLFLFQFCDVTTLVIIHKRN